MKKSIQNGQRGEIFLKQAIFLYQKDGSACRKSLFLKLTSDLLSLSPCPLSPGKGDFTGATAPSPCRGLRPKARMLWLLAKSFARCKTNRASNKRHPIFIIDRGFSTACDGGAFLHRRLFIVYSIIFSCICKDVCRQYSKRAVPKHCP